MNPGRDSYRIVEDGPETHAYRVPVDRRGKLGWERRLTPAEAAAHGDNRPERRQRARRALDRMEANPAECDRMAREAAEATDHIPRSWTSRIVVRGVQNTISGLLRRRLAGSAILGASARRVGCVALGG
jgi:hypothetical protein